jgi:hypothetical protein
MPRKTASFLSRVPRTRPRFVTTSGDSSALTVQFLSLSVAPSDVELVPFPGFDGYGEVEHVRIVRRTP